MKNKCSICGYYKKGDYVMTAQNGRCTSCQELVAGNDNYEKPREEYLKKLMAMGDAELFKETKHKIWLSAYASNNPRSDYHWQCDLTYKIWMGRGKTEEYDRAHKAVIAQCGF